MQRSILFASFIADYRVGFGNDRPFAFVEILSPKVCKEPRYVLLLQSGENGCIIRFFQLELVETLIYTTLTSECHERIQRSGRFDNSDNDTGFILIPAMKRQVGIRCTKVTLASSIDQFCDLLGRQRPKKGLSRR